MRNPDRIPRLLDLLKEIWTLDPDLRLGQILQWEAQGERMNLFYIEDDVMERRLRARLEIEKDIRERRAGQA